MENPVALSKLVLHPNRQAQMKRQGSVPKAVLPDRSRHPEVSCDNADRARASAWKSEIKWAQPATVAPLLVSGQARGAWGDVEWPDGRQCLKVGSVPSYFRLNGEPTM